MTATIADQVGGQLADDLDGMLVGPVRCLLGLDLADMVEERIASRAPLLAGQLCQDQDDRLAAEAVIDVMGALWPHGSPEHVGEAGWWQSPLGRMCARSLGRTDSEAVTQHVAASMLGITRGSISVMLTRGTLDRHPDGGVLRASVLQRLGR